MKNRINRNSEGKIGYSKILSGIIVLILSAYCASQEITKEDDTIRYSVELVPQSENY